MPLTPAPNPTDPANSDDIEDKAIAAVKRDNQGKNFVAASYPAGRLKGTIVVVSYEDANGRPDQDCVFVDMQGSPLILSAEHLARRIVVAFPVILWRLLASAASFSGFIALIITITIAYLVMSTDKDLAPFTVPSVLSGPLGIIIGFYFGRLTFGQASQVRDRAIKVLTAFMPSASQITVKSIVGNFLGGDLAILGYVDPQKDDWECYVYLTEDNAIVYDDMESLATLAATYEEPGWFQLILTVPTFGGIVALAICVTLCVAAIRTPSLADPVPVLSSSFATVLAFYFGSQGKKLA